MKILQIAAGVVVLVIVVLILVAPIGPMPGFFIGGTATARPDAWADTSAVHEIKLKVAGTLPRVVILWVIDHAGELHVVGAQDSGWVTMLGDGGPVEMRLGDNTYSLNASRMNEGWQPVMQAYVDKYRPDYPDIVSSFPSMEEAEGQIAVFRLN